MLTARGITRILGGSVVLDDVSCTVGPRTRLGVVGRNGVGKSTLLRVLAGVEAPDDGAVVRNPPALTVGYLPQEPDAAAGESLRAYLARRTGVAAAEAELDSLTERLADDPKAVDSYTEALERFLALGGDDFEARVGVVCADVGLPFDRLDVEMTALSGGQAARAALAAILLTRVDVLLLDEPTNNLDFAGLDRLEAFLAERPGGLVVVSHDRAFLDHAVDRMLELHEETHRATEFAGGWSDYVAARALAHGQQVVAHGKYRARREALLERARTQRQWSETGVRRAKTSGESDKHLRQRATQRSEKQAAKVRTTERRLERLAVVEKPWEGWQLRMQLASKSRSGDMVVRMTGAVVERGAFRLGPIDVEIGWRNRVALLGPNGSGKSTLLGAMLGRLPLVAGERAMGPGVVVGEMDQTRAAYSTGASVL
ncbi:MAG: ABC-F family ATP-binding cassette domain-containing protein, partial [Actinobacteria bacterium]|nr:ABC-F family ATP-binding cassette domain-containing protein [Actinomycetota bacterium]